MIKAKQVDDGASAGIQEDLDAQIPESLAYKILVHLLTTHFEMDMALLGSDSRLEDLGLDSLEMVDFGLALEQWYGVDVDAAALREARTVGELTALIAAAV